MACDCGRIKKIEAATVKCPKCAEPVKIGYGKIMCPSCGEIFNMLEAINKS